MCFIYSCTISLIQDSVQEGSKGKEDQWEEAALGEDPEKEAEKKSLSVRVTIIRNDNISLYDHVSLAVSHFSNSTLVFLLSLFTPLHYSVVLVSRVMWLMVEVISQGSTF